MDKAQQDWNNKVYDVIIDIKEKAAVANEQNKYIVKQLEILEKRQTDHETLNTSRHKENSGRLDTLSGFQTKQTTIKKVWDKIFSGVIAAVTAGITWYISIHYK